MQEDAPWEFKCRFWAWQLRRLRTRRRLCQAWLDQEQVASPPERYPYNDRRSIHFRQDRKKTDCHPPGREILVSEGAKFQRPPFTKLEAPQSNAWGKPNRRCKVLFHGQFRELDDGVMENGCY